MLKKENAQLRRALREKTAAPKNGEQAAEKVKRFPSERARVREILRTAGILGELSPEEKKLAAEWRALPEAEKQVALQRLASIRLNPPISETIMQDRG